MEVRREEAEIREAWTKGDPADAATVLLGHYGPELLGYLTATLPDATQAREVYALVAEDVWRGVQGFAWRCTARAWAYTLARHARARYLEAEGRRHAREQPLSHAPWLRDVVDRTRSPTPLHLRTEVKRRMRELRLRLDEFEQTLLMLRVDRGMSWKELAAVLEANTEVTAEELAPAVDRLRKRFQSVKEKLRRLAEKEGILGEEKPR